MDIVVGLSEELEELGCVELRVDQAEALGQQAIETKVGPLLHATLEDHVAKLHFLTLTDVKFEELVAALLIVNGGHDYQVDGTP